MRKLKAVLIIRLTLFSEGKNKVFFVWEEMNVNLFGNQFLYFLWLIKIWGGMAAFGIFWHLLAPFGR